MTVLFGHSVQEVSIVLTGQNLKAKGMSFCFADGMMKRRKGQILVRHMVMVGE
jgi:hypothetical protein